MYRPVKILCMEQQKKTLCGQLDWNKFIKSYRQTSLFILRAPFSIPAGEQVYIWGFLPIDWQQLLEEMLTAKQTGYLMIE